MERVLLVIAVVAIVVLVVVVVVQRKRRTPETRELPRDPFADTADSTLGDPRTLRAGDMVEYLGKRLFVRGSIRLEANGVKWAEHYLDDPSDSEATRCWLSVEANPTLKVVLWKATGKTLTPSNEAIDVDGVRYTQIEHGTANYRTEGTTNLGERGEVEYADYRTSSGDLLSFEQFMTSTGETRREASFGEVVPDGTLTVYSSGDPSEGGAR